MSEQISYTKKRTTSETFTVEVEDRRNCFFEGRSGYENTAVYKGIYTTADGAQVIVEIKTVGGGYRIEVVRGNLSANYLDISTFFEQNNECRVISARRFFFTLNLAVEKLDLLGVAAMA